MQVVYYRNDADDLLNMLPSELYTYVIDKVGDRCGRHRMLVGFTTTYAISTYHH